MNVENDFLDTERTSSPEHYINGVRNTYFSYIGSLVKNNFSHIKPIRRQKPLMYIKGRWHITIYMALDITMPL